MNRTELVFAFVGMASGVPAAAIGLSEAFEKVFIGSAVLLMVPGFASVHFVLHRLRTDHPTLYNEIGATNEDLSWGMGDAFRRFKEFIHSPRHRALDDDFLSAAVLVAGVAWRLLFGMAGFFLAFAVKSLAG